MRSILISGLTALAIVAAACGSSTSPANNCSSSSAAAKVNATSSNTFSSSHVTITHGQAVCWENSSSVLHTVTDSGGAFDVNLPAGNIFTYTYPAAGTFNYHCKIHAGMTGTVTVN